MSLYYIDFFWPKISVVYEFLFLKKSVPVFWHLILCPCLLIMALLTKGLPVVLIPEERLIASMRNDMVYHRRFCIFPLLHAVHAQRMGSKIRLAGFLPRSTIATAGSGPYLFRMQSFVLFAVLRTRRYQFRATRMLAGNLRFTWHLSVLAGIDILEHRFKNICMI